MDELLTLVLGEWIVELVGSTNKSKTHPFFLWACFSTLNIHVLYIFIVNKIAQAYRDLSVDSYIYIYIY